MASGSTRGSWHAGLTTPGASRRSPHRGIRRAAPTVPCGAWLARAQLHRAPTAREIKQGSPEPSAPGADCPDPIEARSVAVSGLSGTLTTEPCPLVLVGYVVPESSLPKSLTQRSRRSGEPPAPRADGSSPRSGATRLRHRSRGHCSGRSGAGHWARSEQNASTDFSGIGPNRPSTRTCSA